ncbi:oligopeptide transport system ATP-binding protein [Bacillus horti]|uniref:Oligopeptide transport system ATP-binding protein n=2 Tax=Caldalkalibacillus horti TaxID=77523 RepID=A0ABT9W3Y2_9BACI|nr:oligopeptide/dipeptide ABC transporter ATP-binding protein [Bacillus horti]MDQ0167965.1 oligopeptide transport system ATP-binding protein [Bacillus horti]
MGSPQHSKKLLEVKGLKKHFRMNGGAVLKAVDDVSFDIFEGETLGIVGESGCGKSTTGRAIKGIYELTDGEVVFDGRPLTKMNKKEKLAFTRDAQMIFQDPYSSLNPRMTVGELIGEGIDIHQLMKGKEKLERVRELIKLVGLNEEHLSRFPHEFSGGQRQRIGIARALAVEPRFIVCDEPISALDVSIQAQVINLLDELQKKLKLTYLFIAHDLSMVRHISDRVGVMYLGKLIELAPTEELYTNPLHPYTKALMSAIPIPDPIAEEQRDPIQLTGDLPSPMNIPTGCPFRTRCPIATAECAKEVPEFREVIPGHWVSCIHV